MRIANNIMLLFFQLIDYMYPLIHMEFQERGMLAERIKWGNENHHPSFWPEDIAPWRFVNNPVHPQKYKFPFKIVEIMKIAVYRCLMSRGIDPRTHVREDVDEIVVRNKLRARSMKTLDEAYERFYGMFLLKTEPQDVKHVPEDEDTQRMSPRCLRTLGDKTSLPQDEKSRGNEEKETFENSDEDVMSADEAGVNIMSKQLFLSRK